jgi:hypothetical protein
MIFGLLRTSYKAINVSILLQIQKYLMSENYFVFSLWVKYGHLTLLSWLIILEQVLRGTRKAR